MKKGSLLLLALVLAMVIGTASATYRSDFTATNGKFSLIYNPSNASTSWLTIRNSATGSTPVEGAYCANYWAATSTDGGWDYEYRCAQSADTSSLPDSGIVIDEAWITYKVAARGNGAGTFDLSIIDFTPAAGVPFAANDFAGTTFTRLAPDQSYASQTVAYHTVNLTNTTFINPTGNTTWIFSNNWTTDNVNPAWPGTATSFINIATPTGANPAVLTVIWHSSSVVPPLAQFTLSRTHIRIPQPLIATDASTNTPTSWEWSWGDRSANSTDQNPTHIYRRQGWYTIVMTAINSAGQSSNTTRVYVTGSNGPYRLVLSEFSCYDPMSLSFSREITEYERTTTIEKIKALC